MSPPYRWHRRALEHIGEVMYPDAAKIVPGEDKLNTRGDASLYAAFEPAKARALAAEFDKAPESATEPPPKTKQD